MTDGSWSGRRSGLLVCRGSLRWRWQCIPERQPGRSGWSCSDFPSPGRRSAGRLLSVQVGQNKSRVRKDLLGISSSIIRKRPRDFQKTICTNVQKKESLNTLHTPWKNNRNKALKTPKVYKIIDSRIFWKNLGYNQKISISWLDVVILPVCNKSLLFTGLVCFCSQSVSFTAQLFRWQERQIQPKHRRNSDSRKLKGIRSLYVALFSEFLFTINYIQIKLKKPFPYFRAEISKVTTTATMTSETKLVKHQLQFPKHFTAWKTCSQTPGLFQDTMTAESRRRWMDRSGDALLWLVFAVLFSSYAGQIAWRCKQSAPWPSWCDLAHTHKRTHKFQAGATGGFYRFLYSLVKPLVSKQRNGTPEKY